MRKRTTPVLRMAGLSCVTLLAMPGQAPAQDRAASGTVLVRVVAKASAVLTDEAGTIKRHVDLPDVVVATGSGLVVSRFGYVVTNHHVVADEEVRGRIRGVPARITLAVERIEVVFSPESSAGNTTALEASIVASDSELDLAVLAIPGNDLPYVPLGDSDALRPGRAVSVMGYPLGEALDIGREAGDDAMAPAMASGIVSALRPGADGAVRYIQTSAPLNRGNSGGPLLDRQGFAVGVVQMKARAAEGIGFAIPINLVKDFLARQGLDAALPASRLILGQLYDSAEKLIRLHAPVGFEDLSPSRLTVDSGATLSGVALHIDRIASPWTLEQIEDELRAGRAFEGQEWSREEPATREGRVLRGQAVGQADGRPVRLIYALIDHRGEKIVARYIGAAEQVAFNESVLLASLASLDGRPTLSSTTGGESTGMPGPPVMADLGLRVPAGWVLDAGAPVACAMTAPGRESIVVSPRHDFATSIRLARFDGLTEPRAAAARCGGEGTAEYRKRFSRFGVTYTAEGVFVTSGSRTVQIEVVAPTRTFTAAREAYTRWTAELGIH